MFKAPSKPLGLDAKWDAIEDRKATAILYWNSPSLPNGIIIGYYVKWICTPNSPGANTSTPFNDSIEYNYNPNFPNGWTSRLKGLLPDANCTIELAASTNGGIGDYAFFPIVSTPYLGISINNYQSSSLHTRMLYM